MKVRCDYKLGRGCFDAWIVWIDTDTFYLQLNKDYKTKAGAIKALKRLAKKLNIELGKEL